MNTLVDGDIIWGQSSTNNVELENAVRFVCIGLYLIKQV